MFQNNAQNLIDVYEYKRVHDFQATNRLTLTTL